MRTGPRVRRLLAVVLAAISIAGPLSSAGSLAAPSRAELERARERLMELERDFEIVVERYNAVHERLDSLRAEIGTTELEIGRIERRMGSKQDAAVALARELYMSGSTGSLETVLSSETLAEIESRIAYLRSSEKAQSEVFQGLAVDRIELQRHVKKLDDQRAEAQAVENRLADLRTEIEAKLESQKDEIARLQRAIARAEARRRARERAAARAAAAAAVQSAPVPSIANISFAEGVHPGARTAVEAGLSQVGKPYQWGAAGPDSYDCSGLTMWAWAQAGVGLPHNSGMQYSTTKRVAQGEWQPGDLLFFGSPIHHVGMYIGNGQMVEAPYSGNQVRVVSASRSDYVGAGRPGV